MSTDCRVGFVTAVEIGAACIREIEALGGPLDLIMTLREDTDPSKSGRADVASLAEGMNVPLVRVRSINDDDAVGALRAADLDWLFIIGWSQIASERVLAVPRLGALGAHPTLLPEGRGRAPIPWTILKGLTESGVTLFVLDDGVDTGPVVEQVKYPVAPNETALSLYAKAEAAHRELIRRVWPHVTSGSITALPQEDANATYWPTRRPSDGKIVRSMTVESVDRLVRAVTRPYPGAFVKTPASTIRVWRGSMDDPHEADALAINCADGIFWATEYTIEQEMTQRA